MNRIFPPFMLMVGLLLWAGMSFAGDSFTGNWSIDLRNTSERQRGTECGWAKFFLSQSGDVIAGTHSMSVADCGRINEGGAVKGVVMGNTAVLMVKSGRNGAIVMGTAKLTNGKLRWSMVVEVLAGSPDGDSPLILGAGILERVE